MRTLRSSPLFVTLMLVLAVAAARGQGLTQALDRLTLLKLTQRIENIRTSSGALKISVAYYDYHNGRTFSLYPVDYYAAASMIKLAVAAAVWTQIEQKKITLDTPVRVHNDFHSLVDGATFHIPRDSELDEGVHDFIGRTMTVGQIMHAMLATSSNLGTNVLLGFIGLEDARRAVAALGIPGIDFRRGLGDSRASDRGYANHVNAEGMVEFFRRVHEGRLVSPAASEWIRATLFQQAVKSGIPHGIPPSAKRFARVSHKTGNISTVEHDAGLVYVRNRKPYVLAVLTQWPGRGPYRAHAIARVTLAVHEALAY